MPDVTVTAPQETGRIPYLTQEHWGEIRNFIERISPLVYNGTIPAPNAAIAAAAGVPPPAPPADGPAAGAVQIGPPQFGLAAYQHQGGIALPETVRRGYRSAAEWQAINEDVRGYVHGAPAAGRQRVTALLDAHGFHLPSGRVLKLSEAIHTTEFPYLLRAGFKTILFNAFANFQTTYQEVALNAPSDKEVEMWLELSRLGRPGRVDEDEEYPEVTVTGLAPKTVRNVKKGYILKITEEMIRFDKTNQISQLAGDRGEAMREEIDNAFWGVMTTTGNYTRTSADNLVGNNTGTTTFTPANLIVAYTTLTTMRDARSLRFLGIQPDVLVCGANVVFAATQLLRSARVQSGEDGAQAGGGIGGVGEQNPLFGLVPNIISTPQIGLYNWLLGRRFKGAVYQEVDPLTLVDQNLPNATNEGWFTRDVWRYKARTWYGVGLYDDRYWYLSDSVTAASWA